MTGNDIFQGFWRDVCLAAALAGALTASSCASLSNDDATLTADPQVNHPITVTPSFVSLKLPVSNPPGALMPDDEMRLDNFVAAYLAHGNGSISIFAPGGADSSAAISYFGEKLAAMGVARDRILVGTHDAGDGDGRVELRYITYVAHTDACGDWSKNAGDTASNLPMPDLGCANQSNLAAMVADPRDLAAPSPMGAADATRRSVVMGNYEQGQPTSAQKTPDQSAAISSVK
ncbi:MAG: CpaD family pilus assembly protein [Alphaproteobacteria bacterium]|nr:CpaD family pilus assembly protein [Alphaproteobacteria bacterium]